LSFASALLQALVAVLVVGIAVLLLDATASAMKSAVDWIEMVSYALIVLIGLRLLWVKGRALFAEVRRLHSPKTVGAAATPAHQRHDGHDHHDHHHHGHVHDAHSHHDHADHGHAHSGDGQHHDHGHHHHHHGQAHHHEDDASAWGHAHAP